MGIENLRVNCHLMGSRTDEIAGVAADTPRSIRRMRMTRQLIANNGPFLDDGCVFSGFIFRLVVNG